MISSTLGFVWFIIGLVIGGFWGFLAAFLRAVEIKRIEERDARLKQARKSAQILQEKAWEQASFDL